MCGIRYKQFHCFSTN